MSKDKVEVPEAPVEEDQYILEQDVTDSTTARKVKPAPNTEKAKTSKTSAADIASKVGQAAKASPLNSHRPVRLAEFTVRPVTLASLEMLRMVDSPLVAGMEFEDSLALLPHCLEFLYLHVKNEEEAMDYALEEDSKARKRMILRWSGTIETGDVDKLVNSVLDVIQDASSTQVEASFGDSKDLAKEIVSGNE